MRSPRDTSLTWRIAFVCVRAGPAVRHAAGKTRWALGAAASRRSGRSGRAPSGGRSRTDHRIP